MELNNKDDKNNDNSKLAERTEEILNMFENLYETKE